MGRQSTAVRELILASERVYITVLSIIPGNIQCWAQTKRDFWTFINVGNGGP
jgi:hypothetical protein